METGGTSAACSAALAALLELFMEGEEENIRIDDVDKDNGVDVVVVVVDKRDDKIGVTTDLGATTDLNKGVKFLVAVRLIIIALFCY